LGRRCITEKIVSDHFVEIPTLPEGFKVMFAGNLGEAQDFDNIMKASVILSKEENIKFIIIGDGRKKEWINEFVTKNHLEKNVYLLGRFPLEFMPLFFEKANIMLVSLKDELIFNLTAPAKLLSCHSSKVG